MAAPPLESLPTQQHSQAPIAGGRVAVVDGVVCADVLHMNADFFHLLGLCQNQDVRRVSVSCINTSRPWQHHCCV
jgi:hypothetical protein